MKNFAVTIIIVFSQLILLAQCPPGDLYFSSQAQVDAFPIDYPSCTEIPGSVIITGGAIVNLYGFNNVTSIGGDLSLLYTVTLNNLQGLENLNSIGGSLNMTENYTLNSLLGLNGVVSIGGDLILYKNNFINSMNGLNSLTSIGYSLFINTNTGITSLNGLGNLSSIGISLEIVQNPSLASVAGLESLSTVVGDVSIRNNSVLANLDGLESLSIVGANLTIQTNPVMTSVAGLENLTIIGGDLTIQSNHALSSLAGLGNIDAASISDLTIYSNTSLSNCEVQSICDYLGSPGGSIVITNNATGCDSQQEVEDACVGVDIYEPTYIDEVLIYPNPATSAITIQTTGMPSDNSSITVLNTGGQLLIEQALTEAITSIDISSFPRGVYFVKIRGNNSISVHKMIKQ